MIGYLQGTVLSSGSESAIINVNGVGYEVFGTARLLDRLMEGDMASLHIDTMVREDFIKLYAFTDETEKYCFKLLQTVQGVGAKAALAILQVLTPSALLDAISVDDHAAIARAQGVGKKIATRIASELAGKTPDLMAKVRGHQGLAATLGAAPSTDVPTEVTPAQDSGVKADAVSALVNLGYDPMAARQTVGVVAKELGDANVQALITAALKELSKK